MNQAGKGKIWRVKNNSRLFIPRPSTTIANEDGLTVHFRMFWHTNPEPITAQSGAKVAAIQTLRGL
jgi:hypothetical protein